MTAPNAGGSRTTETRENTLNHPKRVLHFDRATVEAGGCLYRGILWLLVSAVLLGGGLLVRHFIFGEGGATP